MCYRFQAQTMGFLRGVKQCSSLNTFWVMIWGQNELWARWNQSNIKYCIIMNCTLFYRAARWWLPETSGVVRWQVATMVASQPIEGLTDQRFQYLWAIWRHLEHGMKFLRPLLRRIRVGTLYLAKDITKGILEPCGLSFFLSL